MKVESNIFIGIDVSKDSLDISIRGRHYKICNNDGDILSFIKDNISCALNTRCVLESTGGYELKVLQHLQASGVKVHRAHPNKVHAFARACGRFAKTDKIDANLLERYAAFISEESYDIVLPMPKLWYKLKELRSVEQALEEDLHAYQCRLHHLNDTAAEHVRNHIANVKATLQEVQLSINSMIEADLSFKERRNLLTTFKGVGKKIANVLIIEMPELGTLNHKQAASLVGVAPKTQESGKTSYKAHIQGGRFFVRKMVYMAALVAIRFSPPMKKFYQRLVENGKVAKVALTAVMRKVIVCLNSMIKQNNKFTLDF